MQERIQVLGIWINIWRSEGGEPLLFFPGWNGAFAHPEYRDVIPALLDKGFRLYAIEFPGSGKSDAPPKDWTFEHFILLVEAVFTHYKIERACLMGHSLGSVIALRFARYFPHRVKKLILVSAPIFPIPRQIKVPIWLFDKLFWIFAIMLKPVKLLMLVLKPIARLLHFHMLWPPLHHLQIHYVVNRIDRMYIFLVRSKGIMRKILRALVEVRTIGDARLVDIPALLLSGEKDFWTPPRNAKLLAKHMKNAMVHIIPNAPHNYEGVLAEQLAEIATDWLKK